MKKSILIPTLMTACLCCCSYAAQAKLSEVSFTQVKIEDAFWTGHLDTNRTNTVKAIYEQLQVTGRINNFAITGGLMKGEFVGAVFNDSDVYKWLEGVSYILATNPDKELEKIVDETIRIVASAQQSDGYLNTYFTLVAPNARWTDIRIQHELYCAGHLFEAAVAHYQATGKRTLLDVAIKYADYIDSVFGWDKRHEVPGHEEIELALVKLYRVTGEKRYLDLADFFLELRGTDNGRKHWEKMNLTPDIVLDGAYHQDHLPISQQTEIVGHAVRAMYLYSAVADVLCYKDNPGWNTAMDSIWQDMVTKKMYITGGIGSAGGIEGFTTAYDLPNELAYAETCAAIGLVFWNHRLNMLHCDSRYADVLERVLYNNVLAGGSLDGTKFFYTNPLASDGGIARSEFFGCACCPPNLLRLLASLGSYIYANNDSQIYVNLYMSNTAEVSLGNGLVKLKQQTRYPWDGNIKISVDPQTAGEFAVNLRIPQWCEKSRVSVNKEMIDNPSMDKGYACITRQWNAGDVIELELEMPVQRMKAHPQVAADKGRVALQRGPIVYCLESADNGDISLRDVCLPTDSKIKNDFKKDLLGGVMVLNCQALTKQQQSWENRLYLPQKNKEAALTAIPYYAWANREPGKMIIWIPESLD